jgi:heat shock protein HtpX
VFSGNALKTALLLGALTGLLLLAGEIIGGQTGLVFALVLAVVMNFGSYWFSDRIALRMGGAREVTYDQAPQLHDIVAEVAQMSGMPKPRVAIINSPAPNAFATGRDPNHAVVAVTSGIMGILDRRELVGVLAHELGHVRNRDILVSAIAATVAGAITMLAHIAQWSMIFGGYGGGRDRRDSGIGGLIGALALVILAPIAAGIIQMAISRSREYGADATGATVTGDPEALASALEKLDLYSRRMPLPVNPAVSSLFIVKPLTGQSFANLFSTHPPTAERVARLRAMAYHLGR